MADINFNTVTVASAINDSDYLHVTTGGSHRRVLTSTLIAKAKSDTLTAVEAAMLDKLTDGCFIAFHRCTANESSVVDNYPVARKASEWTARQNWGEVADGVLVVSGGLHLVVAPTGSESIPWGSVSTLVAPSGNYSTDREWALSHFDGKARTAAILASSAYSGDGAGYAPGFCAAYSRANANGRGLTAGRWWLPSVGELAMMWANRQKINICLSLITGATQLSGGLWSSSELSAANAWFLTPSNGNLNASSKVGYTRDVRPVSAFLN